QGKEGRPCGCRADKAFNLKRAGPERRNELTAALQTMYSLGQHPCSSLRARRAQTRPGMLPAPRPGQVFVGEPDDVVPRPQQHSWFSRICSPCPFIWPGGSGRRQGGGVLRVLKIRQGQRCVTPRTLTLHPAWAFRSALRKTLPRKWNDTAHTDRAGKGMPP